MKEISLYFVNKLAHHNNNCNYFDCAEGEKKGIVSIEGEKQQKRASDPYVFE